MKQTKNTHQDQRKQNERGTVIREILSHNYHTRLEERKVKMKVVVKKKRGTTSEENSGLLIVFALAVVSATPSLDSPPSSCGALAETWPCTNPGTGKLNLTLLSKLLIHPPFPSHKDTRQT